MGGGRDGSRTWSEFLKGTERYYATEAAATRRRSRLTSYVASHDPLVRPAPAYGPAGDKDLFEPQRARRHRGSQRRSFFADGCGSPRARILWGTAARWGCDSPNGGFFGSQRRST